MARAVVGAAGPDAAANETSPCVASRPNQRKSTTAARKTTQLSYVPPAAPTRFLPLSSIPRLRGIFTLPPTDPAPNCPLKPYIHALLVMRLLRATHHQPTVHLFARIKYPISRACNIVITFLTMQLLCRHYRASQDVQKLAFFCKISIDKRTNKLLPSARASMTHTRTAYNHRM